MILMLVRSQTISSCRSCFVVPYLEPFNRIISFQLYMERNVAKNNNKKEASLPFSGLLTEKEIREGKVRFVADVQDTQRGRRD